MSTPPAPGYDADAASATIATALARPGGPGLLVSVLASVPAAVHTPARKGLLRSRPEQVQIGSWRYQVAADGRLQAAHVVGGVVLSEQQLSPAAGGRSIATALAEHVADHGSQVEPNVEAVLTVLTIRCGG